MVKYERRKGRISSRCTDYVDSEWGHSGRRLSIQDHSRLYRVDDGVQDRGTQGPGRDPELTLS